MTRLADAPVGKVRAMRLWRIGDIVELNMPGDPYDGVVGVVSDDRCEHYYEDHDSDWYSVRFLNGSCIGVQQEYLKDPP